MQAGEYSRPIAAVIEAAQIAIGRMPPVSRNPIGRQQTSVSAWMPFSSTYTMPLMTRRSSTRGFPVGRMRYMERELTIVQPEMISIHAGFLSGTLDQKMRWRGIRFMGLQPRLAGPMYAADRSRLSPLSVFGSACRLS